MEAADREQASGRALGRGPPDARDRLPLLAAIAVAVKKYADGCPAIPPYMVETVCAEAQAAVA